MYQNGQDESQVDCIVPESGEKRTFSGKILRPVSVSEDRNDGPVLFDAVDIHVG